jgi:PAS domain S-box-containing protein
MARTIREGAGFRSEEVVIESPAGRRIHVLVNIDPLRDAEGRISGAINAFTDITERKQVELALRESEERLRALIAELPGGAVFIVDGDLRYQLADGEALRAAGMKPSGFVGKTLFEALDPALAAEYEPYYRMTLAGEPFVHEHEAHGRVFVTRATPLRDANGAITAALAVSYDITERRLAEEALRESFNKIEKTEDELRKLNETLEERVLKRTAEVRQLADRLRALTSELTLSEQRERKRLAQLLHDGLQQILVASRIRLAGLSHVQDEDVRQCALEVCDLLTESIQLSRSLTADLSPPILHEGGLVPALEWLTRSVLEKQGLEVELETQVELAPTVEELNILLFLAVRELLFNIVKHAGVKSARVRVAKRDEMIELTVSDQGLGFDTAQLLTRDGNSGGFGLFSIRERLELLGGSLEIHSTTGQGSRFVLLAPWPDSAEPPTVPHKQPRTDFATHATHATHETGGRSEVGTIRVMLVDDHQVLRQGLCHLIRKERGLDVVGEAADGESAVRLAREIHPDVILMDVSMPGMKGPEATRLIHAELPEIRIIGLSMFEETERAEAMRAAGAVNYLNKSGPSQELIAAIRTCMC